MRTLKLTQDLDISSARPQWQLLDDQKLHQIRFIVSIYGGGLGVTVSCVCTRRKRYRALHPLVARSITSNDDAWSIYESHLPDDYDGLS